MPPSGICVLGEIIERDKNPSTPDSVLGKRVEAAPAPQAAVLPFTGGDLMPLATLSLVLLFAGAVLVRRPKPLTSMADFGPVVAPTEGPSAIVEMPSGERHSISVGRK